jgi:hypothetical protein
MCLSCMPPTQLRCDHLSRIFRPVLERDGSDSSFLASVELLRDDEEEGVASVAFSAPFQVQEHRAAAGGAGGAASTVLAELRLCVRA